MATIEERAERWVRDKCSTMRAGSLTRLIEQALIEAYLAGASQARQDEAEHRAWEQAGKPGPR